jgi:hypothetical protein
LKQIWLAANLPCSKRLKTMLPLWLPGYVQQFGHLSEDTLQSLLAISPATIDRILRPGRIQYRKRGRATTKPGTLLRKQMPIQTNQWDESRPGFLEADTVAHCGESMMGMFAFTIDCVDIATGWTEQRAVWGKGEQGSWNKLKILKKISPFPCPASIVIMKESSSITTSSGISRNENNPSVLPEAERILARTMPM